MTRLLDKVVYATLTVAALLLLWPFTLAAAILGIVIVLERRGRTSDDAPTSFLQTPIAATTGIFARDPQRSRGRSSSSGCAGNTPPSSTTSSRE